jgi:TATA-box binding protein (TBP) (component of TFIID and TFIIIB)
LIYPLQDICVEINLDHVCAPIAYGGIGNTEFNPRRIQAVHYYPFTETTVMVSIRKSGKIQCVGANSRAEAKRALRKCARRIQQIAVDDANGGEPTCPYAAAKFKGFKCTNVCGSANFGFPISLETLAKNLGDPCTYEPEGGFSSRATYRSPIRADGDGALSLLVFHTGAVNVMGAKTVEEALAGLVEAAPHLSRARSDL